MHATFHRCGDRALTVEFGRVIDTGINKRVLLLEQSLKENRIPGVIETIPSYCSLLVSYDPGKVSYKALCSLLESRLSEVNEGGERIFRIWEIPCCYGLYFGRDLERVMQYTGLQREEVIRRHSAPEYRVFMLGFLPGFVYLGGLDTKLETPRLKVPRTAIPRGSVGIGGSQTGVYPLPSPGGWNLIGCTPVDLYDPGRKDPVLCQAGDRIRFLPVSNLDYYEIRHEVLQGTYRVNAVMGKELF